MHGTVIMGCRSQASAEEARLRILKLTNCAPSKVLVLKLDLCSVDSVRQFVKVPDQLMICMMMMMQPRVDDMYHDDAASC